MTTNHHTPLATATPIPATGATLNVPLAELDEAIGAIELVYPLNRSIPGNVSISGELAVAGVMTAGAFFGNGAGLTGIGSGTGGVINTGSTTIGADSNTDGVGVIALQTRGVTRMQVENDGTISICDTDSTTGHVGLVLERNMTGSDINQDNVRDLTTLNPTGGTINKFCSYDTSIVASGAYPYAHLAGFQDRITYSGSDVLNIQWGFYSQPTFNSGTTNNRYGVWIRDPLGAGTLVNNYGIYIDPLTSGTNNYGIYQLGTALNVLGGALDIGGDVSASGNHAFFAYGVGALTDANKEWAAFQHFNGSVTLVSAAAGTGVLRDFRFLTYDADGPTTVEVARITTTGKVGIGVVPTMALSFSNEAAKSIWIEPSDTDVVGRNLALIAGYTVAGTSVNNVAGGTLILASGKGTGTGASTIIFQTATPEASGKTLQSLSTKMTIAGNGSVTITGAFGCNGATAGTAYASGGAITDTADSTYSANEVTMLGNLKTLTNNIRAALVANGIMS